LSIETLRIKAKESYFGGLHFLSWKQQTGTNTQKKIRHSMYGLDNIYLHGPSTSAERLDRRRGLHWTTIELDYWKNRWMKWQAQSKPKVDSFLEKENKFV
jgi:hypothetical protein